MPTVDSSWQNEEPLPVRKGLPLWLKVLVGFALFIGAFVAFFLIRVQTIRARTWPIVLQVAQRLLTDEGAQDLYARNPILHGAFPTADAFLEHVKPRRSGLASLPLVEPASDPERYVAFPNPGGFMVLVRCDDKTWMRLLVQSRFGYSSRSETGEGIVELLFASSRGDLRSERRKVRELARDQEWDRFRKVAEALHTDEGARRLFAENVRLKHSFPSEQAFMDQALIWRNVLDTPVPRWSESEGRRSMTRMHSPFRSTMTMGFRLKNGRELKVVWENEELDAIRLE